ncbi:CAP domain-containing protein [Actinotignum schaalii]|uniref:CAP domain-containing protein n=1 Tax=Actinomycetaceae TaxID=2049 RepID=UPI00237D6E3D|nr:CAP domain-containing protein [Actinotignum schaalii]MDE1654512.1 CAP domain-containing protein [Actinotignum schaalii]
MRTTALMLAGTLLAPLAVHALPATTPNEPARLVCNAGKMSPDQLRACLAKAIKDRDAIVAELEAKGIDVAEARELAQEWAKADTERSTWEVRYNNEKYYVDNFDEIKKKYDDAVAKLAAAQRAFDQAQAKYDAATQPDSAAVAAAQRQMDSANAALEASKREAQARWNRGSLGFFEAMGDTVAVEAFSQTSTINDVPIPQYTKLGQPGDATNLDLMRESIHRVDKLNELRARHGLAPLKISSGLMAHAQLNANVNVHGGFFDHVGGFNYGENIAAMPSRSGDPFTLWYDKEKAEYDRGVRGPSVGHYVNIIDPGYVTTGFAIADPDQLPYYFFGNTFASKGMIGDQFLPGYTTAEYLARLDGYISSARENMTHGTPEARRAVVEAQDAFQRANAGKEDPAAREKLDKAREALESARSVHFVAKHSYDEALKAQKTFPETKKAWEKAVARFKDVDAKMAEAGDLIAKLAKAEAEVLRAQERVNQIDTPVRPADTGNVFYVSNDWTSTQASSVFSYGRARDEVLVGDWNGDGTDTFAVRRGNMIYVKNSVDGGAADIAFSYGRVGDEILVGDFDGDGRDTFAVRRGNTFYVLNSLHSGNADQVINYGRYGDTVYAGDFNGDGVDTFAVRRGSTYFVKNHISSGIADHVFAYGRAGDATILGDFDGDGRDTFAVRRGNTIYVKNSLGAGNADSVLSYGRVSDELYVGDWDGNGTDTPAVRR